MHGNWELTAEFYLHFRSTLGKEIKWFKGLYKQALTNGDLNITQRLRHNQSCNQETNKISFTWKTGDQNP